MAAMSVMHALNVERAAGHATFGAGAGAQHLPPIAQVTSQPHVGQQPPTPGLYYGAPQPQHYGPPQPPPPPQAQPYAAPPSAGYGYGGPPPPPPGRDAEGWGHSNPPPPHAQQWQQQQPGAYDAYLRAGYR